MGQTEAKDGLKGLRGIHFQFSILFYHINLGMQSSLKVFRQGTCF